MTIVDIMSYVTYNNNTALYNHIYYLYATIYNTLYEYNIYIYHILNIIHKHTYTHICIFIDV
jgi:hypothetical protein